MTLVLPHLAFPTTSSLHVETGSPLARLAARSAAVPVPVPLILLPLGLPSGCLVGEAADKGTCCGLFVCLFC